MSRQLVNRLVRIVGEAEAHELLETPNFQLGGRTPQELIDQDNLRPVEILISDMEARERSRRDFITQPFHEVDEIENERSHLL